MAMRRRLNGHMKWEVQTVLGGYVDRPWPNLLEWCKRIWEYGPTYSHLEDDMSPYERVVASAHTITERYRDESRSWDECQKTLEVLKFAVNW